MCELSVPESHNSDERNLYMAASGSESWEHPRYFLCVREGEDHLVNELIIANGT
jgi:hypothetical protein